MNRTCIKWKQTFFRTELSQSFKDELSEKDKSQNIPFHTIKNIFYSFTIQIWTDLKTGFFVVSNLTYGGNRLVCSHLGGRLGPSKCNVHCERLHIFLLLIKYLVHILLTITARFLVSLIKTPVLHKISVLKTRIQENPYKICKKETSTNYYKKKSHIPMFATSPCCGHWLTCFSWKAHFRRRLFFS